MTMTKNQYTTTSSWRPKEQEEDKGQKATKPARQRAKQTNGQEMLHKCLVNKLRHRERKAQEANTSTHQHQGGQQPAMLGDK